MYRLWGPEPGAHPHPLEKHTVLLAKRPENNRSDTFTCNLENFLKGEHFWIISIGSLRHGKGTHLEAMVLRVNAEMALSLAIRHPVAFPQPGPVHFTGLPTKI